MTKNLGPGVSGWLDPDGRNYETVVYQAAKPVLDRELNLAEELEDGTRLIRNFVTLPSGWLSKDYLEYVGDNAPFFLPDATPNRLTTRSLLIANVNGWYINVSYTNSSTNNSVDLPVPPVGAGSYRIDLVVLEVWRRLLSASPDATGKSPSGRIWRNGNVKISTGLDDLTLNYADDILDTMVGSETTKRVQIQYRLRVIPNVDIFAFPYGMDSPVVFANSVPPDAATPDGNLTVWTYANMGTVTGDSGLWRAGDGNPSNTLGTVDGYMYSIPMCAVFRRNTTGFDKNTNHNGGAASPGPSDRPDGLLGDVLDVRDVADLRLGVSPSGWDYTEVLEKNVNALLDNVLTTDWEATTIGGGYRGHTVLWADEIGVLPGDGVVTGDTPGAQFIGQFDGVRRRFSDRATYEVVTIRIPSPGPGWAMGDTFNIDPTAMEIYPYAPANWINRAPANTLFMDIVRARYIGDGGPAHACADASLTIVAGLGVQPIIPLACTVGVVPPGITTEDLYVDVLVAYPSGQGLTKTPTNDYGVANSLYYNNPAQLPAAVPVSFDSAEGFALDYPHREAVLTYKTVPVTIIMSGANSPQLVLPERALSLVSVTINAIPTFATVDDTGRIVNMAGVAVPGDAVQIDYVALRPFPNNGEQVTVYYEARAPQTARTSLLGTSLSLVPRYLPHVVHTISVGSGSPDESYPFPFAYVQSGGVYPSSVGTYDGEHELDASSSLLVADFDADTGMLRLPAFVGYVPSPDAVQYERAGGDVDIEGRTYFKNTPGGYLPNSYAQPLSDPKKHKVVVPYLAELRQAGTLGMEGQIVLVLLIRWARFDSVNGVYFDPDLSVNTTTASVFRIRGNLLNARRP